MDLEKKCNEEFILISLSFRFIAVITWSILAIIYALLVQVVLDFSLLQFLFLFLNITY